MLVHFFGLSMQSILILTAFLTLQVVVHSTASCVTTRPVQCGRRLVQYEGLIVRGTPTKEGDWPWVAAINHVIGVTSTYKCGGTLLNSNTVVTAGHCVNENNRQIVAQRVTVQLGKFELIVSGPNTQEFQVHKITSHPDFDPSNLRNDIALIHLSTEATYNNYVQPICLWQSDRTKLSEVINKPGVVAGWGLTETDELSSHLKYTTMPVVSLATCLESNREVFGQFLSDKSFCAGFRNGSTACSGDSGGALSFEKNGVYHIRGIVSLSAARDNTGFCSVTDYVLFTDVAQYLPWIKQVVPDLDSSPGLMLYRPSTGIIFALRHTGSTFYPTYTSLNGIGGYDLLSTKDRGFAFDYDHSGKKDHIVMYRPGTGTIWILRRNGVSYTPVYSEGDPGNGIGGYDLKSNDDRAFAFDYDHSGNEDHIVLYRPGTGTIWILRHDNCNSFTPVYAESGLGNYDLRSTADRGFAFDYDHSGKLDHIVLYRPGTGTMWILKNNNGQFSAVYQQGDPGNGIGGYDLRSWADRAFAFDYDHSGKMDHIVLYRPGTGTMWILKNNNGQFSAVYQQGDPGNGIGGYDLRGHNDYAFAFDYNGSGKKDHIVLTRPGTGTIWILKNENGEFSPVYAKGSPGNGIGGYNLKSDIDRVFTFDHS